MEVWSRVSRRDGIDVMAIAEGLDMVRKSLPREPVRMSREDDLRMRQLFGSPDYTAVYGMFARYTDRPAVPCNEIVRPAARYCGGEVAFDLWPRDRV
ncbi:MAG TPA: hypothetical protein VJC07_03450 [Candidatus Nanoarchaeia archaeon]|nr:hypothetical protein [Candidatus Nanoarchaeia archaeon]